MSTTESAASIPLFQLERQHQIYRIALKNGSVDVSELAQRFEVTTETIRRDLSDMQERSLVRRVHGGAVVVEQHDHEPLVSNRDMQNAAEKLAIARIASQQIPMLGGTVLLDSGSTGLRLAEVLPLREGLHVVTNSIPSAHTLASRGVHELTLLGGSVRKNTFAAVDGQTVASVRTMRVDVLFVSCDGLSFKRGLTTPYQAEHHVKRAMIESARKVVALVDHSKFGNDQTFSFAEPREIDVLITDARVTDDEVAVLSDQGVQVLRA